MSPRSDSCTVVLVHGAWARMINPETRRFTAERMQAHIRAHDVDHAPLISRPQVVTDIVWQALEHVSTVTESDAQ